MTNDEQLTSPYEDDPEFTDTEGRAGYESPASAPSLEGLAADEDDEAATPGEPNDPPHSED